MKNLPPLLIGIGLILFVVNQPNFTLNQFILISNIGLLLIYMGLIIFCLRVEKEKLSLGSRWVYIPLLVIVVSMIISTMQSEAENKTALIGFAPTLFALYLAGRYYGKQLFKPFIYGVIIASVSMVIHGILNPGIKQGGIISPTNYDIATGFLVFGAFVCMIRRQYIIVTIVLIGLFFTGADEALFSGAVLAITVLIRRDWSKRLLIPVAALIILLSVCTPIGITQDLYRPAYEKLQAAITGDWYEATNERVGEGGNLNIAPVNIFGKGYFVSWDDTYRYKIPHNVPVIVFDQIGIFGGIAWIIATAYCLIKTKWRYAWIAVLSLCVFDHYIWTQAGAWWWVLAGVSTASNIKGDRIFRHESKH